MTKKWILLLLLALCLSLLFFSAALADTVASGSCGENITWTLDDSGLLTISGTGAMDNYDWSGEVPWNSSSETIQAVQIANGVTSIGDYAFCSCYSLTDVTIPSSVTSIGNSAFSSCVSLTDITIPSSVTSIGDYAFDNCYSITSMTIPESVTSVGDGAFFFCSSLESIQVESGSTTYASADGVLFNKDQTTLIACPRGKTGAYDIPSGVTSVGYGAFYECSSLTSVTIPESVTSIGESAFSGCSSLTGVTIPESVTSIGEYVFQYCSNLANIQVESGSATYASADGVLFDKNQTTLLTYPGGKTGTYDIPESVTSIGDRAFFYCDLTSVTIPSGVTSIGYDAFCGCSSLTDVTIPSGVTSIGDCAFFYCYNLTSVTIPSSVTSIGRQAFDDCPSLTDVYYTGSSEQWAAISMDSGNEPLTNAEIHYNYRPITNILTLPASLTTIESEAFTGLGNVDAVSIPATVTSIAEDAFDAGIVIIAPAGSYAETWANDHGFTVNHP